MARVAVHNVDVLNNPCDYLNPLQFEITFDCLEKLDDDLEWKITYVGCPENQAYDQTLDSVVVGPVIPGRHKFVFQADAPDPKKIPAQDAIGVTVVLISCFYQNQEFVRIGYFVNNDYSDSELIENPPVTPDFNKIQRNILSSKPRVTKFHIRWGDSSTTSEEPTNSEQQTANECETAFPDKQDLQDEGAGDFHKLVNADDQKKLGDRMRTAEIGESSNSSQQRIEITTPSLNGHTAELPPPSVVNGVAGGQHEQQAAMES